jgi:hypothetical protein
MSNRFEFPTELDGEQITVPRDIASRLRAKGIVRLRVVLTPAHETEDELLRQGIDAETIERVAATQRYDREVAFNMLMGEGAVDEPGLIDRLKSLADGTRENRP